MLRALDWEKTGQGRLLHNLRHTAACLWITHRVDLATVQGWCGHESAATTNRYLNFFGTGADLAGLERLNDSTEYLGSTLAPYQRRNPACPGPFGLVKRGFSVEPPVGIEPTTFSLRVRRSAD